MSTRPGLIVRALAPFKEFLRAEATSGIVLFAATITALAWANSPAGDSYAAFTHYLLTVGRGDWAITETVRHWINDLLMALFFFAVGVLALLDARASDGAKLLLVSLAVRGRSSPGSFVDLGRTDVS